MLHYRLHLYTICWSFLLIPAVIGLVGLLFNSWDYQRLRVPVCAPDEWVTIYYAPSCARHVPNKFNASFPPDIKYGTPRGYTAPLAEDQTRIDYWFGVWVAVVLFSCLSPVLLALGDLLLYYGYYLFWNFIDAFGPQDAQDERGLLPEAVVVAEADRTDKV